MDEETDTKDQMPSLPHLTLSFLPFGAEKESRAKFVYIPDPRNMLVG